MEVACTNQEAVLAELAKTSPDAPFLALGQTVFWDEPVKGSVILRSRELGYDRRFVAGVHDTDYFAKLPNERAERGYKAFPHNDTTTQGLWSAAGEFSRLFGSETVVTKELLAAAGVNLHRIQKARPRLLDEATEAWGWKGVVSLDSGSVVTSETPLTRLFPVLYQELAEAVESSLETISGPQEMPARRQADELLSRVCDESEPETQTLSHYYRRLLPAMYAIPAGEEVPIEVTATTELLRFNRATCDQPRFRLVHQFLGSATRVAATESYNEALRDSEIYGLDRFGSWAIPFDLVVPGHGRGTLRVAPRAVIVMTPKPLFISLKKPIESIQDLAEAIERKLGSNCTLVGKAVSLIGMLASEFVFVFHEGASSYMPRVKAFHQALAGRGIELELNPILRVRYSPWDSLASCCAWLRLPEPFQAAFGVEELCAPSFASRWRQVVADQEDLLAKLGTLRRPLDLVRFLAEVEGGSWSRLAEEYEELHATLENLNRGIEAIKIRKREVDAKLKASKRKRVEAEIAKGQHWRAELFEKESTPAKLAERERLDETVRDAMREVSEHRAAWAALQTEQDELVGAEAIQTAHRQRQNIELEAELMRLKIARRAIVTSKGLVRSGKRPAAWWFPLLCPEGKWFRETARTASYYLESLR